VFWHKQLEGQERYDFQPGQSRCGWVSGVGWPAADDDALEKL